MNTVHDMGGMHGFGPVVAEPETTEPVFHADWERTVMALTLEMLRQRRWSADRARKMIESQPPIEYLQHSYFENWLASTERLLVADGILTPEELATGRPHGSAGATVTRPGTWEPVFKKPDTPLRFRHGDRVRAVNRNPTGHTRQPRYVRGREGIIDRYCGAEPLPEAAAEGMCVPQHVYRVRFEAVELWGRDATGRDAVYIDLWDEYLEPVS